MFDQAQPKRAIMRKVIESFPTKHREMSINKL